MADFSKCHEDAGLSLHTNAEDHGRLRDIDQVAVMVEYVVQGKGHFGIKSKDTDIVLLIG